MHQGELEDGERKRQGPREVLPEGVGAADWAVEKRRAQNPRIRGLLGCIRVLDGVLESNFAILHCSPRRVAEIWAQVRKVSRTLRDDLAPLFRMESIIPEIEDARSACSAYLDILEEELFGQIDLFPAEPPEERLDELRRLLCVATGQLHSFLQDTLGELMAADPRSQHDADYFLSRRFTHDVDESEWLHTSVLNLERYLQTIGAGPDRLRTTATRLRQNRRVPSAEEWEEITRLIHELVDHLGPMLKSTLGLRGIRLGEMELLDHHATEISTMGRVLHELYRAAQVTIETTGDLTEGSRTAADWVLMEANHAVLSAHMARMMRALEDQLRDLFSFIPIWRQGIEQRRALAWSGMRGEEA